MKLKKMKYQADDKTGQLKLSIALNLFSEHEQAEVDKYLGEYQEEAYP